MISSKTGLFQRLVAVAFAAALGSGWSDGAPAKQGKRGPTQVGYVVIQPSAVPLQSSLGGRTVGFETSEVRPQVNGLIRRRLFTEGSYVR